MEIFEGTYMRPRYSPCIVSKGNTEKAKIRSFCRSNPKSGSTIIAQSKNNKSIFWFSLFGKKHSVVVNFKIKYALICDFLPK